MSFFKPAFYASFCDADISSFSDIPILDAGIAHLANASDVVRVTVVQENISVKLMNGLHSMIHILAGMNWTPSSKIPTALSTLERFGQDIL